jgi:hypothetical protein
MREGKLLPLINEIQRFHPKLWEKVRYTTILVGLPAINEYCGTEVKATDDAGLALELLLTKLKDLRSSSEPPRTSVVVGGR